MKGDKIRTKMQFKSVANEETVMAQGQMVGSGASGGLAGSSLDLGSGCVGVY